MKFFLSIAVLVSLLVSLEGCYVAKPLDHDVRVSYNTDFAIIRKKEGNSDFLSKHTDEEYRKAYIDAVKVEMANDHLIPDDANPEYIVKITSLESTKLDTVKNEKSKDNGMVRELTLAGLKTTGFVTKAGTSISSNWNAEKDKNESLTSNRSLDQMIDGKNKDGTEYREKAFDDNEFILQAGHCGRRAGVRITKEVQSLLNK